MAFEKTGAAMVIDQENSSREKVAETLAALVSDEAVRSKMQMALAQWHAPAAAEVIAETILKAIGQGAGQHVRSGVKPASGGEIKLRVVA